MRKFPGLIQTVSAALSNDPVYSQPIPIGDDGNYWIGVFFSGSDVVGTLSLEATDDPSLNQWFPIPNSSQNVTASAPHAWEAPNTSANYVRVKWDYTSGTGNISARGIILDKLFQQG